MRGSTCYRCGAPIVWVLMSSGKTMPCDKLPTPAGNISALQIGGRYSDGVVVPATGPESSGRVRFLAHWAICPDAQDRRVMTLTEYQKRQAAAGTQSKLF